MNSKLPITKQEITITDEVRNKWQSLLDTIVEVIYGGDEFAIILPLTTAEKAKIIINRFRKKWMDVFNNVQPGAQVQLGFSAGIAEFPQNAENPDNLIRLADAALYESKRHRKNNSTLAN